MAIVLYVLQPALWSLVTARVGYICVSTALRCRRWQYAVLRTREPSNQDIHVYADPARMDQETFAH